jgi:hypothetical protein
MLVGRAAILKVATALLLLAIGEDLIGDPWCDRAPISRRSSELVDLAAPDRSDEPCASVCVPDCFCCSRSTTAVTMVLPPAPAGCSVLAVRAGRHGCAGIHPRVEHPPRLAA